MRASETRQRADRANAVAQARRLAEAADRAAKIEAEAVAAVNGILPRIDRAADVGAFNLNIDYELNHHVIQKLEGPPYDYDVDVKEDSRFRRYTVISWRDK